MTIDKSLSELPKGKKNKRKLLASETGSEEAQMELDQLLKQFADWKKDHKGGWRDFLKSNKNPYLDDIEVIEIDGVKESLTHYIQRMGGVKND